MAAESLTLNETADPVALFARWLDEAKASEPNDPEAVALATVDASGLPDVRMVLMKGFDDRGFVFYTNQASAKGRQLAGNGRAALLFHWKSLRRQVRVRGAVEIVTQEEADAYFASRARVSRLGAIASEQSRPLAEREILEARVAELEARYGEGSDIPRPAHWSGYRIVATEMELWQDGAYRLHDRIRFVRGTAGDAWAGTRLYP